MKVIRGKSIALFFIVIFLFPSVVKLEHHHDEFTCHAKHEKHLHQHHDHCAVCDFHFSLFTEHTQDVVSEAVVRPADAYKNSYKIRFYGSFPAYAFLLRAPPVS